MLFDWGVGESVAVVATATAGGILGSVPLWRKYRAAHPKSVLQDMELIPIRFQVSLGAGNIPEVMVVLYAVNYLRTPLFLDEVRVDYLQLSRGPSLDDIVGQDFEVPPTSAREVYLRRKLLDSEATQIRGSIDMERANQANARLTTKGRSRKRPIRFTALLNFVVHGLIEGLPPKKQA